MASGTTILPLPPASLTGVTSLNGLSSAVTLAAGSGITITPSGQTITIAGVTDATKANVSLNNLSTTAVNVDIVPAADNGQNLGTALLQWGILHIYDVVSATTLNFRDGIGSNLNFDNTGNASVGSSSGSVIQALSDGSAKIASSHVNTQIVLDAGGNVSLGSGGGSSVQALSDGSATLNSSDGTTAIHVDSGGNASVGSISGSSVQALADGSVSLSAITGVSIASTTGSSLIVDGITGAVTLTGPLGGFLNIDASGEVFLEAPTGSGAGFSTGDGASVSASAANCYVAAGLGGASLLINFSGSSSVQTADDGTTTLTGSAVAVNGPTGTPMNAVTPAGYLKVSVNSVTSYIPYYQ